MTQMTNREKSLLIKMLLLLLLAIPCPNLAAAIIVVWLVKSIFESDRKSNSTQKGGGS